MNKIINNIVNQITTLKSERKEPKFVILDIETWRELKSDREYIWYEMDQKSPHNPDKIMGISVAIVTGNTSIVVEVV